MGFKIFLAHLQLDFGKIVVDRVGYLREKNEIHFLQTNGQKMVYYMVKRMLGMSIFWYGFVIFFEKDDIVVCFQFLFCGNVLPIWKIWCLILPKCWSIYQGIFKKNTFFAKKWSKNGLLYGKSYIGYVDFLVPNLENFVLDIAKMCVDILGYFQKKYICCQKKVKKWSIIW